MSITTLRKSIEDNLANGSFILDGLSLSNENASQLLADLPDALQFTSENSTVSSGDTWLQVKHNLGGEWNLSGVTAGVIEDMLLSLAIEENDSLVDVQAELLGSLKIPKLNRALSVSGSTSLIEGMLDIEISTEDLPSFTDLAAAVGLDQAAKSFSDLNMAVPSVNGARFGFDINAKKITYLAVDGALRFGNGALDVSCSFMPDLSVTGSLPEDGGVGLGDIFSTLGIDASNFPDSGLSALNLSLAPTAKTYSFSIGLQNNWSIKLGSSSLSVAQVGVDLAHEAGTTTATITGEIAVDSTSIELSANLDDEGNWEFSGGTSEGSTIKLRSVINTFLPNAIDLPNEVPNMACTDVALTFKPSTSDLTFTASSADAWDIPVGVDGISISDINLNINRSKGGDGKSETTGSIAGTLNLGTASFTSTYEFPGDFVIAGSIPSFKLSPLVQDICGGDIVRGMSVPAGFMDVELKDIAFEINPKQKEMALSANSPMGQSEIQVKKMTDGKWGFTVGFVPPAKWKLSTINSSLSVLDDLKFSNTALILASSEDRSFELATIETPLDDVDIKPGLNLFASLSMKGLGVDELLKIDSLTIYAAIGTNPRNLTLEAQIEGEYNIDKNVAFGEIKFRLNVAPPAFGVMLLGTIHARIDKSELDFIGGLGIEAITTPPSFQARMTATMEGRWQDPMGAKGVAIMDVALDLGVAFPPIRPSIGIAGGLQVGSFIGAAAVKFDTANPGNTMVAIAFNQLYLTDIFDVFCPPVIKKAIPKNIVKTVLDIGYEDVSIYVVPQPTYIGELYFEQGIALKGTMYLWGLRVFASVKIDQATGILIEGNVEPIDIAGVIKIRGAGGKPGPSLYLDLRTGATPTIDISGSVELFGFVSETILQISDTEFYFLSVGKIYNLFEASLEIRGSDKTNGGSIYVKATMKNDLFAYLREKATKEIQAAANDAINKISDAQRKLTAAQNEVNKINKDIADMRATVKKERERDAKRLKDAQNAVSSAQAEVDRINSEIAKMRKTVQAERDRDTKNLSNARKAVTDAQNKVNSLQKEIDSTKARISQLNKDISNKKKWYNKSKWYQKSYRWAEYSAYAASKGTEIGALYTKIGGIETAKATAVAALEVAKQTLRGMEAAAKTIPVDADPRVAGLFAARETANGVLEAAKQTLKGMEKAATSIPIDMDPRIAALFTARETANGSLEAAKLVLAGVKATVGAAAEAGEFIAKYGLGGLIDIREALFEGSLSATQGGRVSLAVKLTFMNKPQAFAFAFNFNDPLSSAKDLAKKLLPA